MRYAKRKYETPPRPWDKQRIERELMVLAEFGLKNKKELWMTEGKLRKYRRLAREFEAAHEEEERKIVLDKLHRLGILAEGAGLEDILALGVKDFLGRRLQTVLQRKGLASTMWQSRQMIVHGHVKIGGRKVTYPSYMVSRGEENEITIDGAEKKTKVKKAEEKKEEAVSGDAEKE